MHFHHRHDVEGCLDAHHAWPEPIRVMLATLDRLESHVSTLQQQIDGLTADVQNATAAIAAKAIDTPDLSGLTAAVTQLTAAAGVAAPADSPAASEQPADVVVAPPAEAPVAPAAPAPAGDAVIA